MAASELPNIVFILCDDLGCGALGRTCGGEPFAVRARLEPLDPVLRLTSRREEDDRNIRACAEPPGHRNPVLTRHHHIHQYNVWLVFLAKVDSFPCRTTMRDNFNIIQGDEQCFQRRMNFSMVVNNNNLYGVFVFAHDLFNIKTINNDLQLCRCLC